MNGDLPSPSHLPKWIGTQRRIGLTGGIATGKSTIGTFLKEKKSFTLIDADIYAREALSPGTDATEKVIQRYGDSIIDVKGIDKRLVNRSALGKIIFSDINERHWLEQVIHPIVKERLIKKLYLERKKSTIILIIPLLFEANLTGLCNEIWVVSCTKTQQLKRLKERDNLSTNEACERINSQWPLEFKKQLADVIIDNSQDQKVWSCQIDSLI